MEDELFSGKNGHEIPFGLLYYNILKKGVAHDNDMFYGS